MFALGLLLVLLGAALVAAEAHVPSHGALGTGAVVALATGVALLLSAAGSTVLVAVFAALGVALAGGAFMFVLVRKALGTRRSGRATASSAASASRATRIACSSTAGCGGRGCGSSKASRR